MTAQFDYKRKSLQRIIDSLQCFDSKDVQGPLEGPNLGHQGKEKGKKIQ
jgi:hypothetical protein